MSRKFYLAYGSNSNVEQMKYRCPGAVMIGKTHLEDYRITFRGNSRSGVANIEPRKGSRVPVGIWTITKTDEKALDRYEGFPFLYRKQEFRVKLPDLRTVTAIAYIMTPGRTWAQPSPYYLHVIRQGYDDFRFDHRNLLYAARTPVKGGVGMSRDWTPEEIQIASEEMKAAGHLGYEEFCEELDEQQAKAALKRFAKVQTPRITCPRYGKATMKDPIHTNALSRFVDVYVCDMCGMAEALIAHAGQLPRLRNWAIIETVRELFDE